MHVYYISLDISELIRVPIWTTQANSDNSFIPYSSQFSDDALWPSELVDHCNCILHSTPY